MFNKISNESRAAMARMGFWQSGKVPSVGLDASPSVAGSGVRSRAGAQSLTVDALSPDEAMLILKVYEESSQGWFWATDINGRLTYLTDRIVPFLTDQPPSVIGAPFADLFVKGDEESGAGRNLSFMLTKQSKFEKLIVRAAVADEPRLWSLSGTAQFDAKGQFTGFRGSGVDITEQRKSSEHSSRLAMYDSLTGLPNRLRMSSVLEADLNGADIHNRPCAVLMLDLDRFKQVNDTLGHPAGDALLKQVADRLFRIVGDKECIFRLGGDEFQVILRDCDDRDALLKMGDRIIEILSQPYSIEGSRCIIGASIGIAVSPTDGRNSDDLIRNADLALYAAKGNGRGCVHFFSSDLLQAAEDKRVLEEDLRDALENGQIHVFYQPIVNAQTNLTTGVEALVRWHHPERGAISPALFIPIAEETNLIGPLGEWVLRKACEDAASWPGTLRVAVNVSPIQFTSGSLLSIVTSALASSGLSPDRLELEITEGVFLSDSAAADTVFASLKNIGVRLALDDFGTGYSSLGYLRTAPFDKIKIDQSFVRAATLPGSRNGAIIAAIVALAEALGMETTAEGIEYLDQLDLICSLRVSHVQGWIYSKAISSEELAARLTDGNWMISPSGPATQRNDRRAMYRKIGIVHGNRYCSALMRNLSTTGALIEGVAQLPVRTLLVVDFGDGQLVYARVVRSTSRALGIKFEQELIDDGNGGLCTSHRVSPYTLAALGLPTPGDPDRDLAIGGSSNPLDSLASRLGLKLASQPQLAPPPFSLRLPSAAARSGMPTVAEMSERYIDSLFGDEHASEIARRQLENYVIPKFGKLRLDQVAGSDLLTWLEAPKALGDAPSAIAPLDSQRMQSMLDRIWNLAADLKFVDAAANPMKGNLRFDRRGGGEALLSTEQAQALLTAARASANRQLKYIVSLLMLTGARTGEILNMRWDHIDLEAALWQVHIPGAEIARDLDISSAALRFLDSLPRLPDCCYVVPNPATMRPYRSLTQSWDVVKARASLPHLELDDLRYCDLEETIWEQRLLPLLSRDVP